MSIPKFSIENSKLINMIMVIVFVFGIFTMLNMPKEEMPAVEFGAFIIIVSYRGVSPLEMEQLVAKKIEDYILQIENIDYASTTCREGLAVIYVSMLPNADIDKAWDDLTTELEKVKDLPDDASDPTIIRMNMREINEICTISIGGDFSPDAIREIADDFKDELLNVENVSKVDIYGTQEKQIWVEADSTKLDQYGLTLNDLINAINMRNMNVPAGTIKFGRAEFIIRTIGEFESTEQIADLIVKMDPNGRAVRIGNVAEVTETLEERTKIGKLNRKPAVNLEIYQMADGNIIKIMKDVRKVSNTFQGRIKGLIVEVRNDGSKEVNDSLRILGRNAIIGIILVFFTLMLFIGWKNALFAAWGIPFSFLFAFILMNYFDITMNNLSLFALILVLGMIVDDAIIVLENIHRHREAGMDLRTAAVKGTEEIMWPVISAVATTVAAFIPMLIMKGMMGKFMRLFPIVVSIALLASLFESLVILPSHVAEFSKEKKKKTKKREPHKLTTWMQKKYRKAIKWALCHRAILLSIVMLSLFLSIAAVGLKLVKIEFFPKQPGQTIILNLSTPIGTNLDKTNEVVSKIEDYIFEMTEMEDIEAVVSTVGHFVENHRYVVETSNAEIKIDLIEADDMKYSDSQIKESLREFLDEVPGLYTYKFLDPKRGPPTGNDIELRVQGNDLKKLEYIGNYILSELEKIPGVYDAETSFSAGKKEIQIIPYSDKIALYGLNVQQIASTISTASYGMTVSKFRGTGLDEYDIIVRVKEEQIKDLTKLKDLKIRTRQGDLIPLKELAEFRITSGYSQIAHRDGKRVIIITGNVGMYKNGNSLRKRTPDEVTEILIGNQLLGREGVLFGFETKFP
ncbi:efflux RND transporter permease subunit, partial [Candidatus Dependentiae bacterium]|nr:efflux RND transporter permease subunit [Candidatus Dependentiae bacterium]